MTSRETIEGWLNSANESHTHMLVVCDRFDHSDYPVYVYEDEDVREKYENFNGKNMQEVMEVYDLKKNLEEQLGEVRAFHF